MSEKVTVMVTGVGGGGLGEQLIKALRFASINYEIVGGDMFPLSKGLMDVDYPYLLPPARHPDYIVSLLAVCKKHNVRALFLGSEAELKVVSKERKRIRKAGIFLPINPESVIDICMDKSKTMELLSYHSFAFPETVTVSSLQDARKIQFLPVVLKPSVGGSGSANVFLAQTREELLGLSHYLLTLYSTFIAQEYVGTPDTEYTVGVLISMDGELLNSIAVKRAILSGLSNRIKVSNRTDNKKCGSLLAISTGISQGEIGRFPEVTKPCEEIAIKLGCRGAVNIQCRFAEGKVYIFEINPRFSGTTSLRAMVGYNEPDVLIRKHVLGESIAHRFPYKSGYITRGLEETFIENISIQSAQKLL